MCREQKITGRGGWPSGLFNLSNLANKNFMRRKKTVYGVGSERDEAAFPSEHFSAS